MADPHRSSFRLDFSGRPVGGSSVFARALATIAGAGAFVIALVVGGALFLVVLALALAFAVVIAIRWWWFQRKIRAAMAQGEGFGFEPEQGSKADGATLEGEYREIDR